MRTVIQMLHEGAAAFGSMPYLGEKRSDSYETTSFAEADEISSAFAASLLLRGFGKGQNVAILSEGRSAWVLGEFGLLKAGSVSVPLSTKLSADEILFRLDHSDARAILVSENCFPRVAEVLTRAARKPVVVCLSPERPSFRALAAGSGLVEGTDLFFYDRLVAEGRDAIERGTLVNGLPVAKALAAVEAGLREDDAVTISYTSGTTGNPKGIVLTHLNYWHNARASAEVVRVERGWKSLIMLPLDHSFAHTVGSYIFLYRGLAMYFVDARGGPLAALRNLPANLAEVKPDFLLTVPALSGNFMKKMVQGVAAKGAFVNGIFERGLRAGIARSGNGFAKPPFLVRARNFLPWAIAELLVFPKLRAFFGPDIKFCVGGGALLETRQQEFFNAIGVPIYQGYGLTENAPIICSNSPARHKFGTSGTVIPTLEVRILGEDGRERATGEIGQIATRGDSVMKGYYRNPEATEAAIRDGWLMTGDLGYMDADGFLVVTGREKALLISADGEKYSPETIEEAIVNTSRFAFQVMAHNEQNRFTVALVTLDAEALKAAHPGATATEVIAAVRDDLSVFADHPDYRSIPAQWRPASFAIVAKPFGEEGGLVNSTMKLVRHKVREVYRDRIDELYASGTADPLCEGNLRALAEIGFTAR